MIFRIFKRSKQDDLPCISAPTMKRQIIIPILPHTRRGLLPILSLRNTDINVAATLTAPVVAVVVSGRIPRSENTTRKIMKKEYESQ